MMQPHTTTLLIVLVSLIVAMVLPLPSLKKPPQVPHNKKGHYAKYIQSKEWKRKRRLRLKFDGGKCTAFHFLPERANLHVHHKTYKRLGNESVRFDLITLCAKHHKKVHQHDKSSKNTNLHNH